jgi:hypothetical protein
MEAHQDYWRACSSCKKNISYNAKYFECSVSTCTGKRTGYVFCSLPCWERHLPGARHRDAGAIEKKSPTYIEYKTELQSENTEAGPKRIIVGQSQSVTTNTNTSRPLSPMEQDVLIVVSKMKQYIKEKSDMNTAGDVAEILSNLVRRACDEAIACARNDGRKTVMTRDFQSLKLK